MLDAATLAARISALRAKEQTDAIVAQTVLSADLADAELLLMADHEPGLLLRLRGEAHRAYLAARAAPNCDWSALDGAWSGLAWELRRAAEPPDGMSRDHPAARGARAGALRALLRAREHFDAEAATPRLSEADRLASQRVHTVVQAARLAKELHPLEPVFVVESDAAPT